MARNENTKIRNWLDTKGLGKDDHFDRWDWIRWFISSNEGRIKYLLEDWDSESKDFIIGELIKILHDSGIIFDEDEITDLIK